MKHNVIFWIILLISASAEPALAQSAAFGQKSALFQRHDETSSAQFVLTQNRRNSFRDEAGEEDSNRGLDRAIRMVRSRVGGTLLSSEVLGGGWFRVVVKIGPNVIAYRVNPSSGAMIEEAG